MEQKTLEETMPEKDDDVDMQDGKKTDDDVEDNDNTADEEAKPTNGTENGRARDPNANASKIKEDKKQVDDSETNDQQPKSATDKETATSSTDGTGAIETDNRKDLPSSILEKGIIYFFTRGRVGIDDPKSVSDLQRSFFVLRPIPPDAKLGDGAIQDLENNRLIAIPKKVLPKSHQDRFMVFVEKGKTTIKDLKESFFQGSEYETKTSGVRSNPPVSPVGEGVYALTTESRNTHLAYMLTIPSELGEIQEDMGIRAKGSFLISLKNPTVSGPANATLPQSPDFPKEVIDEFRGRAWMPPSDPKQLDYANAQFLLIGEGEDGFDKALGTSADGKGKDEEAKQDIEELEHQDEIRVEHLHGDHTIFDDLNISKKEYSLATTW